jgi:CubicO group peptidase (beta-lactamase class C family)
MTPKMPGFSVVEFTPQGVTASVSVGSAVLESGAAISAETRFHVASLSKPVTALVILRLASMGHLDIEQHVTSYIERVRGLDAETSVRHLLSHTSGLRDQWPLLEWAGWRGTDRVDFADAIRMIRRQRRPMFKAGSRYAYSNSGFTLLAAIAEAVTGEPFAALSRRLVFEPLGMRRSSFQETPGVLTAARAYLPVPAGAQTVHYEDFTPQLFVPGPTSLLTTAVDYSKFLRSLAPGGVFCELSGLMQEVPEPAGTGPSNYGLGVFVQNWGEERIIYHSGSDLGFCGFACFSAENGHGVVILANSQETNLRALAERSMGFNRRTDHPLTTVGVDRRLAGFYRNSFGEFREITVNGAGVLCVCDGEAVALDQVGESKYLSRSGELFTFTRGSCWELETESPHGTGSWQQLPECKTQEDPTLGGLFYSDEVDALLRLSTRSGLLHIDFPKGARVDLRQVTADGEYCGGGLWLRQTNQSAPAQGVELSSARCTGVRYLRVGDLS